MAGRVRHPIDIRALESWLAQKVTDIEAPLDIKQVGVRLISTVPLATI